MLIVINILNIFCLSDSVTLLMLLSEFLVLAFGAWFCCVCAMSPSSKLYCVMYDLAFMRILLSHV
jgi:hypothetical protein